jgi:ferritin-like protein
MAKEALDLINRQKAEIERLMTNCLSMARTMPTMAKAERAEAITEYYEEVKKRCIEGGIYPVIVKKIMEDVRKEMT